MHRKRGLRIFRIWEKAVRWVPASERESRVSELGQARRICALRAPRVGWVESWRCKSSLHGKIVSLSPHVEKPLNSKRWIKVSYLNQFRKCRVFRIPYVYFTQLYILGMLHSSMRTSGQYIYHHHHHHHHIALVARISLTLSRHSSRSFIALGWSSGQHPVSSHSCWMYVRAGRPAFARPCVGVHWSTSLMSSSLLLQQCPACLSFFDALRARLPQAESHFSGSHSPCFKAESHSWSHSPSIIYIYIYIYILVNRWD